MSNRFVPAALAGGVVMFLVGGLLYGVVAASFFAANQGSAVGLMKDPPDYLHLAIGQMVMGAYLAVVMNRWARVGGVAAGLRIGAISGVMIALGFDLTAFGTTNVANITATLVDPVFALVQSACAGAAVGAVLGNKT